MCKIPFKQIVFGAIVITTSSSHFAIADNFSFNIGSNFTSGKYGKKTSTHIWHVPFTARYRYKRASFRVTVPYLNITRPINVRTQGGVIIPNQNENTPTGRAKRVTQRGFGDTSLALTYNLFYHRPSRTRVSITGRLKVPTGNAALGLGTGKVGYAVQTNLYKARGRFNFTTLFGYRMPGSPTGIKFSNIFYGAAGVGYRTSTRSLLGTRFNISQSVIRRQDSRTLMAYFLHQYGRNIVIQLYGLKGFSERSPEWGSGISLRYIL